MTQRQKIRIIFIGIGEHVPIIGYGYYKADAVELSLADNPYQFLHEIVAIVLGPCGELTMLALALGGPEWLC
jgi:hypothetical protein